MTCAHCRGPCDIHSWCAWTPDGSLEWCSADCYFADIGRCPKCDGDGGWDGPDHWEQCPRCKGAGEVVKRVH